LSHRLLAGLTIVFLAAVGTGPLVALRVAIEDVARGDMGRRLQLRWSDRHFREIEVAFNQMMESLNERMTSPESSEAEDWDPDSVG
jgi:nitrogen fixation/metabolism regulation signal transduction histidine kinase